MLKIARRGRSLSFKYYMCSTCSLMFYIFMNLLKFYRNLHHPERKLIYHFVYPYNAKKSPHYELTYFIQLSGGMYTALINATVDSFISMLLLHISAQLKNLRITLNKLVEKLAERSISSSRFKKSLVAVIVRHEDLIRNAETIDKCYSAVLFVHMIAVTFQLCFETFQVFTIITDKNADVSVMKMSFLVLYTICVLLSLYFYCYSAETLLAESTGIAYGVYKCKWYDLPSKITKDLMFIVYRSKIPLRLTAGKFGTFSLEMFETIVKTSMGYVSALLTMNN